MVWVSKNIGSNKRIFKNSVSGIQIYIIFLLFLYLLLALSYFGDKIKRAELLSILFFSFGMSMMLNWNSYAEPYQTCQPELMGFYLITLLVKLSILGAWWYPEFASAVILNL